LSFFTLEESFSSRYHLRYSNFGISDDKTGERSPNCKQTVESFSAQMSL